MAKFKHKGYVLIQEEEINHHYSIFDDEFNFLMHSAYNGGLFTQAEAEYKIDTYIAFLKDNDVKTLFKGMSKDDENDT